MLHCQVSCLLLLICPLSILVSAFDRIEKFYPTTFDRDALESGDGQQSTSTEATMSTTQGTTNGHSFAGRKIKLTAPDDDSSSSIRVLPRRRMKSKGVVLDDVRQESTQQVTATSNQPVETPSIPSPSESQAENIPEPPQPFIPSAASAKQYFYNIDRHLSRIRDFSTNEDDDKTSSSSHPSPSTTIPSGPWSQHHDPQMVLVFAHSVEIPLVVTPPRNMMSSSSANPSVRMASSSSQPRFVYIRGHLKDPFPHSIRQQHLTSSIENPSNPSPASSFRHVVYTPFASASHPQELRHLSPEDYPYHQLYHSGDSTPSSSNRRPFTVLPMTRYTYYDHEASASDNQESREPQQRTVTLFHPMGWAPTTLLKYQ